MGGTRPADRTQFEVWVTREASEAINVSARKLDITRGRYMQLAIWEAIKDSVASREMDVLLPCPITTAIYARHYADPKPGYKGRWAMWVRVRCTVHNSVPMRLTRLATQQGHGSASALVRHHLAIAIKRDTGKTVPMPNGRSSSHLFGGKINEVVL